MELRLSFVCGLPLRLTENMGGFWRDENRGSGGNEWGRGWVERCGRGGRVWGEEKGRVNAYGEFGENGSACKRLGVKGRGEKDGREGEMRGVEKEGNAYGGL